MDRPNDIDYAIYEARLEGLSTVYLGAVAAYRQGVIDALSAFAKDYVPDVRAVRLTADVDWRWCFNGFVDAAGEEIETDFGDDFYFEDLFSSSYLSELDDFERGTAYVYVYERKFSDVTPQERIERGDMP